MPESIIEPRRTTEPVIDAFRKYNVNGGVRYPIHFAIVKYGNNWSQIRSIKETSEHKEAEGEFIMVSRVSNSKTVMIELAPKIGRLWHVDHLELDPSSRYRDTTIFIPKGAYPPAAYASADTVNLCGEYIDPLTNAWTFYELLRERDTWALIRTEQRKLARLRTPDEFARAISAPVDHDIAVIYSRLFPKLTELNIVKDYDCLFYIEIQDRNMAIHHLGRSLTHIMRIGYRQRQSYMQADIPAHELGIAGINIFNIGVLYPDYVDVDLPISELVVPMAAFDFSVNEFSYRGASNFIKVKVPDSLPEGYHYPYLWHVMAGEEIITPCFMENNDPLKIRVYTPMGNSVPVEHFEVIQTMF